MDRHATRRDKLRRSLGKAGVDALLVTSPTNVTYLTGFTGEDSYVLIARRKGDVIISDARFSTQLTEECPGLDTTIRPPGVGMVEATTQVVGRGKPKRLGIEAGSLTVGLFQILTTNLPRVELVPTLGLVEALRIIKDKQEVAEIRRAVAQAEAAFLELRASLSPDKTEKQVADDLEYAMRKHGAKGPSFPTIVAVGARAALPHARPTSKKIGEGSFVLVDWGADSGLYKSDLTRVLVTGKIAPKLERVYRIVLDAQRRAIERIRPGVTCEDVDNIARKIIADAGFARYFGHGLGHGIGLQIHEAPRLGRKERHKLEPGMIVTVEPGIYLPRWGGVRIEDDVLVTKDGHEVLTSLDKEWENARIQ